MNLKDVNYMTTDEMKLALDNLMSLPSSVSRIITAQGSYFINQIFGNKEIVVPSFPYRLLEKPFRSNNLFSIVRDGGKADLQERYGKIIDDFDTMTRNIDRMISENKELKNHFQSFRNDLRGMIHEPTYDQNSFGEFLKNLTLIFVKANKTLDYSFRKNIAEWAFKELIPFKAVGIRTYNSIMDSGITIDRGIKLELNEKSNRLFELITEPLFDVISNAKMSRNTDTASSLIFFLLKESGLDPAYWNLKPLLMALTDDGQLCFSIIDGMNRESDMLRVMETFSSDPIVNQVLSNELNSYFVDTRGIKNDVVFADYSMVNKLPRNLLEEVKKFNKNTIDKYLPGHENQMPIFSMSDTIIGELKELDVLAAMVYISDSIRYIGIVNDEFYILFRYKDEEIVYGLSYTEDTDGNRKLASFEYDTRNLYGVSSPEWIN